MSHGVTHKFHHEAMFYANEREFVAGTIPFIREGVRGGEPVFVVESREKIELLRKALGRDAERVMFADMSTVGANPARIIPAWRDFVEKHGAGSTSLRGIGEPIWKGRSADELAECQRHESLLNVAFGTGRPWSLLCPYDMAALDAGVIEEAERSHEYVSYPSRSTEVSSRYRGLDASGAPFDAPLGEPGSGRRLRFDTYGLVRVRGEVIRFATASGVSIPRATQFVTAVNEVATNSIVHGGGQGTLRLWHTDAAVVAEISDAGMYDVPLGDRIRPGELMSDSRGLWLANELCDLVQIRTLPSGTVARLHMKVDSALAHD